MDLAANPAGLGSANPVRTQHRGALAPICDVVSARCAQMLSQSLKFVYGTYPGCVRTCHWQILQCQMCCAVIGMRGTPQSSNHSRDLHWMTAAARICKRACPQQAQSYCCCTQLSAKFASVSATFV